MLRKIFFTMSLLCLALAGADAQEDKLLTILKQELKQDFEELQKQEVKPYYMSFRVEDTYQVNISSNFGTVNGSTARHLRLVVPQVRLGSPELDNFKYTTQGNQNQRGQGVAPTLLPLDDNAEEGIRAAIWKETMERYKFAYDTYEQTKTRANTVVADEDKAPCFSAATPEHYYEPRPDAAYYNIDRQPWEARLNEVSRTFQSCPELQQGEATLTYEVTRTYFVNTDGTEVVQNRVAARIILQSQIMADDGMQLPLMKDYFSYDLDQLPSADVMVRDAKDLIVRLRNLKNAPVANPYTGPAILSGPASGVFFHEIFGHRLEGHRLKGGGETFKKMVGKEVLPHEFQVYCDPTLRHYAGTDLNGYYLYDSEGVKARRVDNVVDGVLRNFLMSRVPLDGFPQSNGHGRTSQNCDPVSRQSNLIVETTKPYTDEQLRQMLKAEAKKQGKEYGYYFKTVTSGFTLTGEGGSLNSFNVTPIEVYRIYVDGRPDELVRGVDLIGTPLAMFSHIEAAGNAASVFTGSCGAESGWVPVTASSPVIYVNQIETQRRQKSTNIQPILPAPAFRQEAGTPADAQGISDDDIFAAMHDELKRTRTDMTLAGAPRPFYVSYITNKYRHFNVSAELGGLTYSDATPGMRGATQVWIGDFHRNSELKASQFYDTPLQDGADYSSLRRSFWQMSDNVYKASLNNYTRKMAYLNAHPQPQELAAIDDAQQVEPCRHIADDQPYAIDQPRLEALATRLSAIFKDYPELYNTSVSINGAYIDSYRSTSEDVDLKDITHYAVLRANATFRSDDGTPISDVLTLSYANTSEIPNADVLEARVRQFADDLMQLKAAPTLDRFYKGPVMFEGLAASYAFTNSLLAPGGIYAQPSMQPDAGSLGMKKGFKIVDGRITVKNYTNRREYAGQPLFGAYTIDADGLTPAPETTIIDKGILQMLLNRTTPAEYAPASTGSARLVNNPNGCVPTASIGTLHVMAEKTTAAAKMKAELLKAGRKEKLEYVYKVICPEGSSSVRLYRVDVRTGEETLVKTNNLSLPTLSQLERVLAISSQEKVDNRVGNVNTSVIYPSSLIVDYYEINKANFSGEKAPVLTYPLMRGR